MDPRTRYRTTNSARRLWRMAALALALLAARPACAAPADTPDMMPWVHAISELQDLQPGSQDAARATAFLVEQLKASGITDVRTLDTQAACRTPGQWLLEASDSRNAWYGHPSFWVPGSPATTPDGVLGEPIYVRDGADIEKYNIAGRVVLFDAVMPRLPVSALGTVLFDPDATLAKRREDIVVSGPVNLDHIFEIAEKKQAAALAGLLTDFPYDAAAYYARPAAQPPVPMLWVPRPAARELLDDILHQRVATLRVVTTAQETPCAGKAAAAFLPGRSDRWFLVRAQFDGPFGGAVRDASGAAAALALAAHFAAPDAPRLDHGLIFLFSAPRPGGRHPADLLAAARPDIMKKIRIDLTIGPLGLDCEDKRDGLICSALPAPRAAVTQRLAPSAADALTQIIQKHNLVRTAVIDRETPPPALTADLLHAITGAWAAAPGIPGIAFTSWPLYIASPEDTPDKIAPDQLQAISAAFADLLTQLDPLK